MSNGYILYEGPSLLDGEKIVVIATMKTTNEKTGSMVQSWILRADQTPTQAVYSGDDFSICGNCHHRGVKGQGRTCYVETHKAPTGVYSAYRRGTYPKLQHYNVFQGKGFRFGAYGDPAAAPLSIWEPVLKAGITRYTGYTHQWRTCHPRYKAFLMASVDSEAEKHLAEAGGWRTFRVGEEGAEPLEDERFCPATKEGGKTKQCITCGACGGNFGKAACPAKNILAIIHGKNRKKFVEPEPRKEKV